MLDTAPLHELQQILTGFAVAGAGVMVATAALAVVLFSRAWATRRAAERLRDEFEKNGLRALSLVRQQTSHSADYLLVFEFSNGRRETARRSAGPVAIMRLPVLKVLTECSFREIVRGAERLLGASARQNIPERYPAGGSALVWRLVYKSPFDDVRPAAA